MLNAIIEMFVGCQHQRTTFPLTPRSVGKPTRFRRKGGATYVACLDCGAELEYDWKAMKVGKRIPRAHQHPNIEVIDAS